MKLILENWQKFVNEVELAEQDQQQGQNKQQTQQQPPKQQTATTPDPQKEALKAYVEMFNGAINKGRIDLLDKTGGDRAKLVGQIRKQLNMKGIKLTSEIEQAGEAKVKQMFADQMKVLQALYGTMTGGVDKMIPKSIKKASEIIQKLEKSKAKLFINHLNLNKEFKANVDAILKKAGVAGGGATEKAKKIKDNARKIRAFVENSPEEVLKLYVLMANIAGKEYWESIKTDKTEHFKTLKTNLDEFAKAILQDKAKLNKYGGPLMNITKNFGVLDDGEQKRLGLDLLQAKVNLGKEPKKEDPEVNLIRQKYGKQISAAFPDVSKQNAIEKFLIFLDSQKLLKEGPIKDKIAEYLKTLEPEDKKAFMAILKDKKGDFLKFKKLIDSVYKSSEAPDEKEAPETEGGDDEEIVDPDPEKLEALKSTFGAFKNQFYKKKKLREQSKLVTALLKALKAFFEEESAEAYGRRADRDRSKEAPDASPPSAEPATPDKEVPAKRDDLYEVEEPTDKEGEDTDEIAAKPKDIRNFKTSVRSFQRALKLSEKLVDTAMDDTDKGKLVSDDSRDKVVKFATATQEKIKMLNDSINTIMGPVERGSIKEKLSPDIEAKMQKYRETLDRIEDVYETIVGTDLEKGGLGRIVDNLVKGVKMSFDEIERGVKKALELLSTIKKFFPSIVPFEGSKIESTEIVTQYKQAIAKLDLDSSDIQTLKDVLEGDQGKVAILGFQDRIIEFSKDIERIFGIPGLTEKDSADPDAEREDEEAEEEEAELDALKDGAEKAKAKYASDEFIMSLESEEVKTAFYYLISYFMSKGLITENIADTITNELGEALKVLDLLNPKYAKLVKQVLNDKKKADGFIEMLQRVGAKGIDEMTTVAFNTTPNIYRFITLKLLKNKTITARMEALGLKSGSQDENNLLRFLAYMLASNAEFFSQEIKENLKAMNDTSKGIGGPATRSVLKKIFQKDKELYNWAKEWFGANKMKAAKLFNVIKTFIDKKRYKFNTKGLKIGFLTNLTFAGPSEIPEKEADATKKVIEKIKDAPTFDMDNYDGYEELKTAIATKVVDVMKDDNNEKIFSWSSEQPDSTLFPIVQDLLASAGDFTLDPEKDPFEDSKFKKKYAKIPEFDSWKQMSKEQKTAVLKAIEKYDDEEIEDEEPSRGVLDVTESRLRRAIKKYIVEVILKSNWQEMTGDLKTNDLFKGKEGINLISSFFRDFQDNYGDEIQDDPKGDDKKKDDKKEPETTKESFKEVLQSLESIFEDQYKQKYTDGKHFLSPEPVTKMDPTTKKQVELWTPSIDDKLVNNKGNIITDMILRAKYPNITIEIQLGRGRKSEETVMYKFPQPLSLEKSVPDFVGVMNKAIIKPGEEKDDKKKEEPSGKEVIEIKSLKDLVKADAKEIESNIDNMKAIQDFLFDNADKIQFKAKSRFAGESVENIGIDKSYDTPTKHLFKIGDKEELATVEDLQASVGPADPSAKDKEAETDSEPEDKWKAFFDKNENIEFYKNVNRLYRNVDEKTGGKFNQTDKWLDTAADMLQEETSVDFDKFQEKLEAAKSFIKIIKTKQTDKLKDKGINSGFARLQDYMKYFEKAWKKYKPEDDFPSPPIGFDSPKSKPEQELTGLDALAKKLEPFVNKELGQPENKGKDSDELLSVMQKELANAEQFPQFQELDDDEQEEVLTTAIEDSEIEEPTSLLGQASIEKLKNMSKEFVEDEILQLAKAWEDSLSGKPLEEERKLKRRKKRKPKGTRPKSERPKDWQIKLKKTWETGGEINDTKHVKLAMQMIKTEDPELQKLLKKVAREKASLFDAVYTQVKKALNKQQTQQERLERALRPLIEKLMRG